MAAELTIQQLYAAIQAIAASIGHNCEAGMRNAIKRCQEIEESTRIKPAELERVYPETGMTGNEAYAIWVNEPSGGRASKPLLAVANASLRHAIDNGQVVTREEFDKLAQENAENAELLRYLREKLEAANKDRPTAQP